MAKILLVDDEPRIARVVRDMVEGAEWQFAYADNGADALDAVARDAPDLIIMDVMMPKMDGFTACRELRTRGVTVPVIFLSAKGDIVDKGVKQDGTENTTAITPYQFWSNNYSSKVSEANVFDATFVKLREMVLSYQMPQRWFKNCFIGSLALGVEGRNLWLMKSNVPHIDPETNIFGPSAVGSGVEYSAIPTTRSWGFNIKLTF